MNEIWKTIENYETYSVSDLGRVRNDTTGKILKGGKDNCGYLIVTLCKNGEKKKPFIHRLVARAFIPNPEIKGMVDHNDNDKTNNLLENLRWATNGENMRNTQLSATNTSGVKGVNWHKRCSKWEAQITLDGKKIHLGYFTTLEEATTVRQAKAAELFGVFTNLCEIPSIIVEKLTA